MKRILNKDITFIYMDTAEKSAYQPIYDEAEKRGYKVKFTTNKLEKCEIGFYCQHVNFPQFSKFSVIMLHDIIQGYSNWPDLWYREPWNKYDVGIIPSDQWEVNWNKCSQYYYARPKRGMYKIGWPKADVINKLKENTYREDFYKTYGLDINKKTVLYAPAWENDGKQDDFVKAMLNCDVNILIKQADWNKELYPEQVANVNEMYKLHKNIKAVTILPPKTNIFEAIAVSDILVSEESSTMCEAAMMGIPAVSVYNWLIPDVTPSRFPKCDYDFVVMTAKEDLEVCIRNMISNYEKFHNQSKEFAKHNFLNIGNTANMIMDIIDDFVNGKEVRYISIKPNENVPLNLNMLLKHNILKLKIEISQNYGVRYKFIGMLYKALKKLKNKI